MPDTRGLSLNELIGSLHDTMRSFALGLERIIDANTEKGEKETLELIGRISDRLKAGHEVADNAKVIELLNLLVKDQHALKIAKQSAGEWLKMLDAIEQHIEARGSVPTARERSELKKINALTAELRRFMRK
jgi:hypothetical protein